MFLEHLSRETIVRTLQLLEAIAKHLNLTAARQRTATGRILEIVESVARRLGLLPALPDPMPTVTKSIGTSSRDYSTITLWEADLDNGGIYSSGDAAVGECYNDSAFNESPTINGGGTVNLASVKLTVPSAQRHDGTSGTGARIVRTSGTAQLYWGGGKPFELEWLEFNCNDQLPPTSEGIVELNTADVNAYVRNMLIHHALTAAFSGAGATGIRLRIGSTVQAAVNCIVYDLTCVRDLNFDVTGILANFGSRNRMVCNCTVHKMVKDTNASANSYCYDFGDASGDKLQNNIGTDPSGTSGGTHACYKQTSFSNATVDHNAASDTTASGTGSLDSVTTADQYVSTVDGSEDLHLKAGADCIDAGTDLGTSPTGVNIDIDGRDRDAEGDTWDIGADEFVAVGGTFTASAALGIGAAVLAAAATFGAPVYSATAALLAGNAELSAAAEFDQPVFSATSGLVVGGADLNASAEFDNPVYTAGATLLVAPATLAASAEFDAPIYSAIAALTIGRAVLAAIADTVLDVAPSFLTADLRVAPMLSGRVRIGPRLTGSIRVGPRLNGKLRIK